MPQATAEAMRGVDGGTISGDRKGGVAGGRVRSWEMPKGWCCDGHVLVVLLSLVPQPPSLSELGQTALSCPRAPGSTLQGSSKLPGRSSCPPPHLPSSLLWRRWALLGWGHSSEDMWLWAPHSIRRAQQRWGASFSPGSMQNETQELLGQRRPPRPLPILHHPGAAPVPGHSVCPHSLISHPVPDPTSSLAPWIVLLPSAWCAPLPTWQDSLGAPEGH